MLSDGELVRLNPASPLIGMSTILEFLQRQAARQQKQQEELLLAMAVLALLPMAAYSSSTGS